MKLFNLLLLFMGTLIFSNTVVAEPVPYCTANQLAIYNVAHNLIGMDGTSEALFGIINIGQTSCYLRGIPEVGIVLANQQQTQLVKFFGASNSKFKKYIPNENTAKNIIVNPYQGKDTLNQLVYFSIYFPGGGYSDDNAPVSANIKYIKLPGIDKLLPLLAFNNSHPVAVFVVSSAINKDPSNWFTAIKKAGHSCHIDFAKLAMISLQQIIAPNGVVRCE